ncbi:MAG: hypothetical protein C0478_01530 [Planctomyces sp.]|nr:hypothetical protein [Planctomyces sp.]
MVALLGGIALVGGSALADGPADNQTTNVRPVPPPGIAIDDSVRKELEGTLSQLEGKVKSLSEKAAKDATTARYLPDVEIYSRGVRLALAENTFYDAKEFQQAKDVLAEGLVRAEDLAAGKTPWTTKTGLVVRGFRSKLDGSVQPYGVVVPSTYSPAVLHRCDLWFRGRAERTPEMQFIHQRSRQVGEFAPARTIVVHPFARFCNANKLAGEVDSLEALEHVQSQYAIDPHRISIRGFSMGGAAVWHLAVHYPDRWFAANPGAGFSETPLFLNVFQQEKLAPSDFEQTLWKLYDAPYWALNLRNLPTIAYSGEIDKQKQAADVMEAAMAKIGDRLVHIIGPQTAHKLHPDSKIEIERRMASLADVGRPLAPREVHFTTCTLKYDRSFWVRVVGLEEHWKFGTVQASIVEPGGIRVKASAVTEIELSFPSGTFPLSNQTIAVEFVGSSPQMIEVPGGMSDRSWTARFHLEKGRWKSGLAPVIGLKKIHGLQGPIDDALMDSFAFVLPSKAGETPAFDAWVKSEATRAQKEWLRQMRGDVRLIADDKLTPEEMQKYHLILWGDENSNRVIAKLADQLPIKKSGTSWQVGGDRFSTDHHAVTLIHPNPLAPSKYVVLNSGLTYREYDYLNNARQVPKLPDWAIIDVRTPPDARFPGKIVKAGFFGEDWQLKPGK